MFSLSNPEPNPDVVQRVVADVGHACDLLAAIVATSTVHTAVISQKRENISVSDKMSPTTRETLCSNGFVIQRTNVKRKKKWRKKGNFYSDPHVITTKNAARPGPKSLGPLWFQFKVPLKSKVLLHLKFLWTDTSFFSSKCTPLLSGLPRNFFCPFLVLRLLHVPPCFRFHFLFFRPL